MKRRRIFMATYWDLLEAFFEAQRDYQNIYMYYESSVLAYAEERGVDRRRLRLSAAEVSGLLDFERLGQLRRGSLYRTKTISHALFRNKDTTSRFDRHISEIFHELSILREEQYKVSTFAEDYRRDNDMVEYESMLDEVHEDFPRRVSHIHTLFLKAQAKLEQALQAVRTDPIYLRSLFLFGDEILRYAYPEGPITHAWRVYEHGPGEAFYLAARSFARRGFRADALSALDRALEQLSLQPPTGSNADADDLLNLGVQVKSFREFVEGNTPSGLVRDMRGEARDASHGDDAAPDVGDDALLEDDEIGDFSEEMEAFGR